MSAPSTAASAKVLFFSRGRGRGHAVPDDALCREVLQRQPSLDIRFVSCSTGAKTLRDLGWDVIEAPVSERNHFSVTMRPFCQIIQANSPAWVVSHEEPGALIAASACGIPSAFLTDWFRPEIAALTDPLGFATKIVFLDEPGLWPEPPLLAGKVVYTGPVFRNFQATVWCRRSRRLELGIDQNASLILVDCGGPSEQEAPLRDLVLRAFERLHAPRKHLLWVAAEPEHRHLEHVVKEMDNVTLIRPHTNYASTMLACDLALTKGNRITCLELNALGIPTVAVLFRTNPIDERRISFLPNVARLHAPEVSVDRLEEVMRTLLQPRAQPSNMLSRLSLPKDGRITAANELLRFLCPF